VSLTLDTFKKSDLSSLLKSKKLPYSGNKQELIKRISGSISNSDIKAWLKKPDQTEKSATVNIETELPAISEENISTVASVEERISGLVDDGVFEKSSTSLHKRKSIALKNSKSKPVKHDSV